MKNLKKFASLIFCLVLLLVATVATVPTVAAKEKDTNFSVSDRQQAICTTTYTYVSGSEDLLQLNGKTIFSITERGLNTFGAVAEGVYPEGTYGVKLTVNPTQKLLRLEITLPDGGTLRRGTHSALADNTLHIESFHPDVFSPVHIAYEDISTDSIPINSKEPAYSGFEAHVYNLITSFDIAQTTRNFAWTAEAAFVGGADMAVMYRATGTDTWEMADARRAEEKTEIADEDFFKAEIRDLQPDTEYEYKIGLKGSNQPEHWGKLHTFRTAAEDIDSFSFIAFGDAQATTWSQARGYKYADAALRAAMEKEPNAAFVLNTGDSSENGYNRPQWKLFFKALGDSAALPHFATIGNHDTGTDGEDNNYFSFYFNHPDNGADALDLEIANAAIDHTTQVQIQNPAETIYSFDYGDAHFTVLNNSGSTHLLEAQRAWLAADLQAHADAKWKILLFHEPVYRRTVDPVLYDTIESLGVDLVIQGHTHRVTRTYPMKDGQIVTKQSPDQILKGIGTVYTTVGSTTTNHDGVSNIDECLEIIGNDNYQPAYTVVRVEDGRLEMTVRQLDGAVLDSFIITETLEAPADDAPAAPVPDNNGDSGLLPICAVSIVALAAVAVFRSRKKK